MNFIEAGHRGRRQDGFGIHDPAAHRCGGDRSVTRAGRKDAETKIAAGGIERSFLERFGVEDLTFADAVALY